MWCGASIYVACMCVFGWMALCVSVGKLGGGDGGDIGSLLLLSAVLPRIDRVCHGNSSVRLHELASEFLGSPASASSTGLAAKHSSYR